MTVKSQENLKAIRFQGELLPNWAQLLDVAARLCPMPEDVRHWFSRLTSRSGVEDARRVREHCVLLRSSIQEHRPVVVANLERIAGDAQPAQILAAWLYALDTMIQVADAGGSCSWEIDGTQDEPEDDGGGEGRLRRL